MTYEVALALTLAVEVPLAVALAGALAGAGARRRALVDAPLLQLLTHPLACAAYLRLGLPLVPIELAVTVVEAVGYRVATGLTWRRAALVSLACNAVTTGLGLALARTAAAGAGA